MAVVEFRGRVMASRLHVIAVDAPASAPSRDLDAAVRGAVSISSTSSGAGAASSPRATSAGSTSSARPGAVLSVDPSTLTLLATMIEGYEVTAGRFDPAVLPALIAEGYAASHLDPRR